MTDYSKDLKAISAGNAAEVSIAVAMVDAFVCHLDENGPQNYGEVIAFVKAEAGSMSKVINRRLTTTMLAICFAEGHIEKDGKSYKLA
jgi:hypothetical protein